MDFASFADYPFTMPEYVCYTPAQQEKEMKYGLDNRLKTDLAFYFHQQEQKYAYYNKEELEVVMKHLKKSRKNNIITMNEDNNTTHKINGKKLYIMVIQETEEDNNNIDPMGLAFEDGFVISGMIIAFKNIKNRDMVYNYVMGIKK